MTPAQTRDQTRVLLGAAIAAGTTGNAFVIQATQRAADAVLAQMFPDPPSHEDTPAPPPVVTAGPHLGAD